MKVIYDALKKFMLTDLAGPLSEAGEGFPVPDERNICYGTAQLDRNEAKIVAAIVPDSVSEDIGDLASGVVEETVIVCMAFRGLPYPALVERMETYAASFRMALRSNPSLGGMVESAGIGRTEYYPDAGASHGTLTVAEIEVTVRITEKKADGIDPFC